MISKKAILVSVGFILVSALVLSGPIMSHVDEPKFKIEETIGDIQIRTYEPMILAQVSIEGNRKYAVREGFMIISDYISGNNESKDSIAMMAPVFQHSHAPYIPDKEEVKWTVSFVMPQTYTLDTLPKANNSDIKLSIIPSKRFVVIRFSGLAGDDSIKDHLARLTQYVTQRKLKVRGEPLLAFYNPPWTLPILRRNEIMLEVID